MSLQVWLPLLGNLNNNGLSDVTVTNNGATVASDGKIGSCYSFDGDISYLLGTHNFINNNTDDWSFCCWMKVNNVHTGCLFSCRNNVNYSGITIFYYGSQWIIDDGNRWQFTPTITIAANTWYHVCVVRKKGVGKFLYINGVLDGSTESVGTQTNVCPTHFSIGACQQGSPTSISYNWYNGYLNDVRFYDNALSIKEIKEVSKGLIVHYPLNGILPLDNIVRNDQYMAYNNYSRDGHTATLSSGAGLSFNGCKVWRLTYTPTSTNLEHVQTTLHGHGVYIAQKTFKANTKYCFWILWRAVSHPDTVCGGTASNIKKWTEIPTTKFNDEWNIVGQYRDGTVTEDKTDGVFTSFKCPSATAGTPIIIDFCCPHLVEGYDYILDEDDYQDNFDIYDISGYKNNVLLYNNITNGNPIKYNKSTYFNGTNAFIACGRGSMVRDAITVNFWAYMDNWTALDVIASCTESGGYGFSQSSSKLVLWMGTGQSSNTYKNASSTRTLSELSSGWHMITGTYDGFSTKLYIDGVLEGNNTAYTTKTPIFYNANNGLILGGESTGSQTVPESGRYTECNLSDFRVYATALPIDDIKELYEVSALIDKQGILCCSELIEGYNNSNVLKSGVINSIDLLESHSLNQLDGNRDVSFTPANVNNSTLQGWGKWLVPDGAVAGDTFRIKFNIKYENFDTSSTAGTFNIRFQGANYTTPTTSVWAGVNPISTALNSFQSLKTLVLSSTTGTYTYETTFTLDQAFLDEYVGSNLSIRSDYSNGTAKLTITNTEIIPEKYCTTDNIALKLGDDYISTNEFKEI